MGDNNKNTIVAILRDLAKQIQSIDDEDMENVLNGKLKLQVQIEDNKKQSKTTQPPSTKVEGFG